MNILNKPATLYLFAFFCAISAIAILLFAKNEHSTTTAHLAKESTAKILKLHQMMAEEDDAASESVVREKNDAYTDADAKETVDWMMKTGRFTSDERQDYESYNDKILTELAQQGDLKALHLLGDRCLENFDREGAGHYYELAAVRESIAAIQLLAVLAYVPSKDDETHKMMMEVLALNKTIGMRGDEVSAKNDTESILKSYEHITEKKLELSTKDYEEIDKRATEIYNSWQTKRLKMGLGEFDNSKPIGANIFFDAVKKIKSN